MVAIELSDVGAAQTARLYAQQRAVIGYRRSPELVELQRVRCGLHRGDHGATRAHKALTVQAPHTAKSVLNRVA
jgi:hypothetical protein